MRAFIFKLIWFSISMLSCFLFERDDGPIYVFYTLSSVYPSVASTDGLEIYFSFPAARWKLLHLSRPVFTTMAVGD